MKSLELTKKTTLKDALFLMDQIGYGFLPVVDKANKLIGIITDGDIRRAILKNQVELDEVINKNPQKELANTPVHKVKSKLKALHRRHMPIVDEQGHLVDVILLDDFDYKYRSNWVIIMAGGLGSRLGELTKHIPKPMLEVNGKPILLHIIEQFQSYGFGKFVLCVNYKSNIIEEYFGDGSEFGITIKYTHEKKRLGTAGALTLIDIPLTEPFIVINGDVFSTVAFDKLLEYHISEKAQATMCIKKHPLSIPFAAVDFDKEGNLTNIQEKPTIDYYINTGIYVLNRQSISFILENEYYDMPMLFESMMARVDFITKVFKVEEYWLDLGRPADLKKIGEDMSNGTF